MKAIRKNLDLSKVVGDIDGGQPMLDGKKYCSIFLVKDWGWTNTQHPMLDGCLIYFLLIFYLKFTHRLHQRKLHFVVKFFIHTKQSMIEGQMNGG